MVNFGNLITFVSNFHHKVERRREQKKRTNKIITKTKGLQPTGA